MERYLWAWVIVFCMATGLGAQTNNNGARLTQGSQEVGVWAAYSPDSTVGIGQTTDRKFFELDGQYAVTMLANRHVAWKWVMEAVPVALLNEPTEYYFNTQHQFTNSRVGATTYAGGITPLGMQVNFRNGRRVQPFFDAHGGALYFTRQEPVPNSSQYNFTFNFGAGVQIFAGKRSSLLLGYKYHHISNANTATKNPGVDSPEAYAGWLWRWKQ